MVPTYVNDWEEAKLFFDEFGIGTLHPVNNHQGWVKKKGCYKYGTFGWLESLHEESTKEQKQSWDV